MNKEEQIPEIVEATPVERPDTEIAKLVTEGDPDIMLAILEKKAELAPRFKQARDTILASQTLPQDWKEFDGVMCLSSAGAERVATLFDIQFFNCSYEKRAFTDAEGRGYMYHYVGNAQCGNRVVYAQGVYSTRDKFLGKSGGEWRPVEEINERDIMQAAYHIFKGNAVKELLGLRQIPRDEWERIVGNAGIQAEKAKTKVTHGSGTSGGTSKDDHSKQKELAQICIEIANANNWPEKQDDGTFALMWPPDEKQGLSQMDLAREICIELSTFTSKDGKVVTGKGAKDLKGKWLDNTLKNARKLWAELEGKDNDKP